MKPICQQAVQIAAQKLGRQPLTASQLKAIDDRISSTMRRLARTDATWQAKSADQRVIEAAKVAMADIAAEATRKVENAQRQIIKTAATESRVTGIMGLTDKGRSKALVRDLEQTHQYVTGIRNEAISNMIDMMDAAKDGTGANAGRRVAMFLFDAENPVMTRDLVSEIFRSGDGSTGNHVASEGAKAYFKVADDMRQRFNSAGGDVGQLDYGYLPQPHDASRVRASGRDTWVAKTMPQLDRARYVLEDGARMGDAELIAILGKAWETIATEGVNKVAPGTFTSAGAKANAGSEARQIHFRDGDGYMAYMQEFGNGSMYDAMTGHIGKMARDIGLVERYGPNPNAQMRLQFDLAGRNDGRQADNLERSFGIQPQSYWDVVNGTTGAAQSATIASIGLHLRAVQTMGKLGGAVISSITDLGTYAVTTGFNKLSYWDAFTNIGKSAASKDARDFMTTHGLIAESMMNDMNRWAGDNLKQSLSGRLANSTLKLSLMNAWTDTLRRAFSLTMMQGLSKLSKTEWAKLSEWDRSHLERKGMDEADWAVINRADLTTFSGRDHLTPESIRATGDDRSSEIVAKVLGLIQDESEFAVMNPDLATKAAGTGGGLQAGTVPGELARSVMQFKSFPVAMVSRHWRRMLEAPKVNDGSAPAGMNGPALANRLMYGGALMLTTTALGAIALQAKQIVAGKDPIDMQGDHAAKFWAKAVAQGGGLSIVGDLILNDPANSYGDWGANLAKTMAGPGFGTVADLLKVGTTNAWRAAEGKQTHTAAQSIQLARSNAPYVNLWYAKAAVDHAGLHALQENLSPGYLGKMQQRAKKDFGQDYWLKPGTGLPDRAPDFGKAVGKP